MIKDKLAKAVSRLWTGRCDVVNYVAFKDKTGVTSHKKILVAKQEPCRISFESSSSGAQSSTTDNISQEIKLFVANAIEIKPGSEISVTQNGVTKYYISSGVPAVYTAHQEVLLVDREEYA